MALFITFEGVEGCGKSTQSRLLKRRLESMAVPVLLTHEPGVTALGKRINRLLKWSDNVPISPLAELLLFNTSRTQLVEEIIRPELAKGTLVICDRYADSTTSYQGYGRFLDLDIVAAANDIGTQGLAPDLTILLDMPVEEGMTRKIGDKPDRFENESVNFHRRVREGYLTLADAEPQRWLVIDGMQDKAAISGIIWQKVNRILSGEE